MQTRLGNFCDRLIESGWILSLVLIPLLFNPYADQAGRVFEGSKVFLLRSITLTMLLAWLIKWAENGRAAFSNWKFRQPLILFPAILFGLYLISTFLSPYFPVSWRGFYLRDEGFYTFLSYIIIFFLVIQGIKREGQVDFLVNSLIIASIPITAYAILQHFGKDPMRWVGAVRERVTSTFGGPIFLGAYLVMVIPLTLSRLIGHLRVPIYAVGYSVILTLQLLTLYFTQSRGPWLGFIVSLVIMILTLSARLKMKALFISIIAVGVLIGVIIIGPQIDGSPLAGLKPYLGRLGFQPGEAVNTIKSRLAIWESGQTILSSQPTRLLTGYGLESLPFLYFKYYNPRIAQYEGAEVAPDHSHNDTLDLLITIGLPGALVFALIIIAVIYAVLKYLGIIQNKKQKYTFYICVVIGLVISVTAGLILGKGMLWLGLAIPLGILFGTGIYLFIVNVRPGSGAPDPLQGGLNSTGLLLIGLLGGLIAHFVEIQVGMGLTTTRLYFWGFLALIISIILSERKNSTPTKAGPPLAETQRPADQKTGNRLLLSSLIAGTIIAVSSFYLTSKPIRSELLIYLISLWAALLLVGGLVMANPVRSARVDFVIRNHLSNGTSNGANRIVNYLLYIILGGAWGGLFILVYKLVLDQPAGALTYQSYLSLLYIWVGLNLLISAFLLPGAGSAGRLYKEAFQLFVYLISGFGIILVVYYTNIEELYAETYYKEAERTKQLDYYKKCIEISPHTDYYYDSLASEYLRRGDYQKSIEVLEGSRQANPHNPRSVRQLAKRYQDWAQLTPEGAERQARFHKSLLYYQLLINKYALTNPIYKREMIDVAIKLCEYYFNQKQYQEFIRVNEVLIKNDPSNYQHHYYMAIAYRESDRKADALKEAETAFKLAPADKKKMVEDFMNGLK